MSISQTSVITSHDNLPRNTTTEKAYFTGDELLVQDQGVDIRRVYDVMGRVEMETVAEGTAYEAVKSYHYDIETNEVEITDGEDNQLKQKTAI